MKKIHFLFLFLMTLGMFGDDLTTISGKEYKNYSVKGVSEKGIMVSHSSGVATVPLSDLPDDLRKKYTEEVARIQAAAESEQIVADSILDKQRGNNAEPVSKIREKLQKVKNSDQTITVHDKDGRKHENCRIQRIGASGLTLKINGTSVYIPFRWIKKLTNGVLAAPSFAVNLPQTQSARENSSVSESSDSAEGTVTSNSSHKVYSSQSTTVNATYTGPRGGTYYYNSKGNKTYVRRRR